MLKAVVLLQVFVETIIYLSILEVFCNINFKHACWIKVYLKKRKKLWTQVYLSSVLLMLINRCMKWLCAFQQHHHSKNKSQTAAQTLLPKPLDSQATRLERLYLLHLQTKTVKWIKPRTVSLSLCPSSHGQNMHYISTYVCTAVHRCCQILHYKNCFN